VDSKANLRTMSNLEELGIKGLLNASIQDLVDMGLTKLSAQRVIAAVQIGTKISSFKEQDRYVIRSPEDAANYLMDELQYLQQEHFVVVYLNTKNEVIFKKTVFIGSLNASIVHPREVFAFGVKVRAASFVAFHNHPSGTSLCSNEDVAVTKRLQECGALMGVEMLDHIIIGAGNYYSMKEKGHLN
jgi:DNA repair protein RadC